jgi:hypothetical protein
VESGFFSCSSCIAGGFLETVNWNKVLEIQTLFAQFIAVCSLLILAETLDYAALFSSPWRGKRRVFERCKPFLMDQLQPSTNSDKLSDKSCSRPSLDSVRPHHETYSGKLSHAIQQSLAHYHTERNHQGLGNQLISPEPDIGSRSGQVRRRKRLGGLLSYYYREAA